MESRSQKKEEEDSDWGLTSVAWWVVSYPFRGAWNVASHAATIATTRATQLPGKALSVASNIKERVYPTYSHADYQKTVEEVKKKQDERKEQLAEKEQEVKKETSRPADPVTEVTPLLIPKDPEFDALLERVRLSKETLDEEMMFCDDQEAFLKVTKANALGKLTQAHDWLTLKANIQAVRQQPDYSQVISGFFSHRTRDRLKECAEMVRKKLGK